MLNIVTERLSLIQSAIAARTEGDQTIVGWAGRELLGLIQEINAFLLGAGR